MKSEGNEPHSRPLPEANDEADWELIRRIGGGDRMAFERLYKHYYRYLFRFVYRVTHRLDLVEEIINEVMFVVWQKARTVEVRARASTWIMGIAYKKALKALQGYYAAANEVSFDEVEHGLSEEAEAMDHSSMIDLTPQASLARLLQRLDSEMPPADRHQKGWNGIRSQWTRFWAWLSGVRLPQRAWVAVPLLAILLLLAPITRFWLSSQSREPQYHTLSSPNSVPAADSTDIQVIFAKTLTQEQIQQMVRALPAEIVAGPSASGAYTIRMATRDRSTQDMLARLVRLSQQPGVLWVEPADATMLPKRGAGSDP